MRAPIIFLTLTSFAACLPAQEPRVELPLKDKSVRLAVIGDNGTGARGQYDIAQQMVKAREKFPFDLVLMLGDNIYGADSASDFKVKFETPYKPLLDSGVKFYASLGNHDNPNQRFYKPFNMGEKRYYNFKKGNAEFFALDSNYMDAEQLNWIKARLEGSKADWKICFFHHPLYTDARFHGPDVDLRTRVEPLFTEYGVKVVLSGHEHVYERLKPQKGIQYFVLGSSGQLRPHDLRPSAMTAKGYDVDQTFMLVEIAGDEFYFQTISRAGQTVDSGVVPKQKLVTESVSRAAAASAVQ
jgi:3',5'-cyclic AMP phosphodiesterase CpdA